MNREASAKYQKPAENEQVFDHEQHTSLG